MRRVGQLKNSIVVQKPYAGAQLLTAISTLLTAANANKTS